MKKIHITGAVLTVLLLGSTLASSALADSKEDERGEQPHKIGMGMMMGKRLGNPKGGVFGTITAINGTTVTVSSRSNPMSSSTVVVTYTVDASKAVIDKNQVTGTISTLAIGDAVFVEGTVTGNSVVASKIHDGVMMKGGKMGTKIGDKTYFPVGNGQPIIGGTVSAVAGNTITITNKGSVSYSIDASAAVIKKAGATSTVSSIAVGDSVIAQGTINGTSVVASSITDQGVSIKHSSKNDLGEHKGAFKMIGVFFAHLFGF